MSSDSDDLEDLKKYTEAIDKQFFSSPLMTNCKDLKSTQKSVKVTKLDSNTTGQCFNETGQHAHDQQKIISRKDRQEDAGEKDNYFGRYKTRVTPEFKTYVSKRLSTYLDHVIEEFDDDRVKRKKKKKKPNVSIKLCSNSSDFLKINLTEDISKETQEFNKINKHVKHNRKKIDMDSDDLKYRSVVVNAETIFEKRDVQFWTPKKAPIDFYKRDRNGDLIYVKPKFKLLD